MIARRTGKFRGNTLPRKMPLGAGSFFRNATLLTPWFDEGSVEKFDCMPFQPGRRNESQCSHAPGSTATC